MGVKKSTFVFTDTNGNPCSNLTIDGGSIRIGITRDNQLYAHKLLHGYGQFTALPVGDTEHIWSPTADDLESFWLEVPTQKTRSIDVYLDTYTSASFKTKVGRDIHSLTVTLSEDTGKPTVRNFTVTDSNTLTKDWGIIIPGKSNITSDKTVTTKYGSTLARSVFFYGDNEFYYIDDLIASLPLTTTPTNYDIGFRVTDSRGFVTTSSVTKSIASYKAPTVDTFEVVRCDNAGNETNSGTKAKLIAKGSWSYYNSKNTANFKIGYKKHSDTSYTEQTISVTGGTVDIEQVLSATFDADTDYDFKVSFTDSFSTYSQDSVPFSNSQSILYVSADGTELIFGGNANKNVRIGSDSVDIRNGSEILASFGIDSEEFFDRFVMEQQTREFMNVESGLSSKFRTKKTLPTGGSWGLNYDVESGLTNALYNDYNSRRGDYVVSTSGLGSMLNGNELCNISTYVTINGDDVSEAHNDNPGLSWEEVQYKAARSTVSVDSRDHINLHTFRAGGIAETYDRAQVKITTNTDDTSEPRIDMVVTHATGSGYDDEGMSFLQIGPTYIKADTRKFLLNNNKIGAEDINGWHCVYLPGGYVDCFRIYYADNAYINNSWGSIYESDAIYMPNFPFEFAEIPSVSIEHISADDDGYGSYNQPSWIKRKPNTTTQYPGTVWLCRPDHGVTIGHPVFSIRAIGKMKA